MPLSDDRNVNFYASSELIDLPVDDNVVIYRGAFVGRNRATGYVRGLVAGDEFVGLAQRRADNTAAGHVAGGITVRVQQRADVVHALSGATQDDLGKEVYASDDATLTLAPGSASRMGRIVAIEASGLVRVRTAPVFDLGGAFEGLAVRTLADASATLTLDQMNRVLLIANTAARTLTLPPAATCRVGAWLRVVKTSAAAFAVTLDGHSAETIDGAATLATIDAQFDVAHLLCTGSDWIVLSRDIA